VAVGAVVGGAVGISLAASSSSSTATNAQTIDDYVNLTRNVPYIFDPCANDIDPTGFPIFFLKLLTFPLYGTYQYVDYGNGSVVLNVTMTSDNFTGYDSFRYQGYTASGKLPSPGTIYVSVYNVPPVAVDYRLNVFEDSVDNQFHLLDLLGTVNRDARNRYHGFYKELGETRIYDANGDDFALINIRYKSHNRTLFDSRQNTHANDDATVALDTVIQWNNVTGEFHFTPQHYFIGSVTLEYNVSDSRGPPSTGLIIVQVLDTAPIVKPLHFTVHKYFDSNIDILTNVIDPNGDVLHLVSVTPTSLNTTGGSVVIQGDQTVDYTPLFQSKPYEETFMYSVTDGEKTSNSTVTIQVINEPPVMAANVVRTIGKGDGNHSVPIVYSDFDLYDNHTISIVAQPEHGVIYLVVQDEVVTVNSSITGESLNVTQQKFTVLYERNMSTPILEDFFTIAVSDGYDTAVSTVQLHIRNSAPVAISNAELVLKNQNVTFTSLLNSDYDPDDDLFILDPSKLLWSSRQGGIVRRISDTQIQYSPPFNFTGHDEFNYTIIDLPEAPYVSKNASTVVHVEVESAKPVARDDYYRMKVGGVVQFLNLLANDTDPDGDPLSIISVEQPSDTSSVRLINSTTVQFTSGKYPNTAIFRYTISDTTGATSNGTVYVELYDDSRPACKGGYILLGQNPIWPPNNYMRLYWLFVPGYYVDILSVLHNDVTDLYGPDAYILPLGLFSVRGERTGANKRGRVYKINYIARKVGRPSTDDSASALCYGTITSLCVPHDQKKYKEQCTISSTDQWIDATRCPRRHHFSFTDNRYWN